jgi:hypothetical protein
MNMILSLINELELALDVYLVKKAPALKPGMKEKIMQVGPTFMKVFGIIGLIIVLALLLPIGPFATYYKTFPDVLSLLALGISLVLQIKAIAGLMKRTKKGWDLMYYSTLLSILSSAFRLDIFGTVIGGVLGLYLIFQVREYYK